MKRHLLFALIVFLPWSFVKANDQSEIILGRYKEYLLNTLNLDKCTIFCNSINKNNRWDDITYTNNGSGVLNAREHLVRVRTLAAAWANKNSGYYHSNKIWVAFERGLKDWLEHRYQSQNWWHNEIGTPQIMRDIIILTRGHLSGTQYQAAMEVFAKYKVNGTGANLIWSADLGLHYAALLKDLNKIRECSEKIISEVNISAGDGIKPDYSFHQHYERLQTHHYGSSYLKDNIRIAWELRGTEWQYPESKIKIITDFVLEGWQWMSRGLNATPGTLDRAVSREGTLKAADLRLDLPYLMAINKFATTQLKQMADWQEEKGSPLNGFRYFHYSDFAAYHQEYFSFFLKTISSRTRSTEIFNGENLKGALLNEGNTYFIHDGTEYFNLMPFWDWKFLPGSTSFSSASQIKAMPYTGGLSDGKSGMVNMSCYLMKDSTSNLTANKMWVCHNNTVVCLIANIKVRNLSDSIFTAMDQSRLKGDVIVNGKSVNTPEYFLENVKYIYHNHFLFKPVTPLPVKLITKDVTANWSSINISGSRNMEKTKVFMPLLYHNINDQNVGYSVTWCPNVKKINQVFEKNSFTILRNDSICQAVKFNDGVVMMAFIKEGTLALNKNQELSVDKECSIMIKDGQYHVSVSLNKDTPLVLINRKKVDYMIQTR
ncbi:MAG: polysaccharide lyase family 8 super-sandwich domain-containing protein [Bacteroidales bacterium]|nr:polysaccharide lyase family 8 super-sandwich domain-containing protein [Bacteroidales bacterium]